MQQRDSGDETAYDGKGHGHVWPRPDGYKARCGGVGICGECTKDYAAVTKRPQGLSLPAE